MTRLIAFVALIPLITLADIIPEPPLAQGNLPGSWEAVAEADSTLRAVYRMEIADQGESYLVEVRHYPNPPPYVYLLARLVSSDLKDGKIRLSFAPFRIKSEFDAIVIEASAFGKEQPAICGKLTKRSSSGYTQTEQVNFKKGPTFAALLEASKVAEEAINKERKTP
jgi:hypothetical protein